MVISQRRSQDGTNVRFPKSLGIAFSIPFESTIKPTMLIKRWICNYLGTLGLSRPKIDMGMGDMVLADMPIVLTIMLMLIFTFIVRRFNM
jgi:hypothetical protein